MAGVVMAFQDFKLGDAFLTSQWVGLTHFRTFLQTPDFYRALRNTLVLGSLFVVFAFPMPIILALMLNELRLTRFRRVSQTISYLPHFISWVVVSAIVLRLLNQQNGLFNNIIEMLGGERIGFMREPSYFWAIIILAQIWKSTGWGSIIYLSALASVDHEIYEAAMVDGAGRFKTIWHISLPSIFPTMALMGVLSIGNIITSGGGGMFDAVFNLQNPLVAEVATTIDLYAYNQGINMMRYSYATAITLAQSVIALLLVWGSNRILIKVTDTSIV